MKKEIHYYCPAVECKQLPLEEQEGGLRCRSNEHFYLYAPGTKIPVFVCADEDSNEYTLTDAAKIHDNSLRWLFKTFKTSEVKLRKSLVSRLRVKKGDSILVTGAGAGNDLPFLAESLDSEGVIHAQDFSKQMLLAGAERYGPLLTSPNLTIQFSVSDATNLPFRDAEFDAAYHFGGINLFPDIAKGIAEMNRVVRPGGRIVIGDEGIAPWLKNTEIGKMLIKNNPLYSFDAPLHYLPESARNVVFSWEMENCFYVIEFTVSDHSLQIDIDIPHVGRRGGSIRTRYYGQLEGIDPELRNFLYKEAERLDISRVDYLERLLKIGYNKDNKVEEM